MKQLVSHKQLQLLGEFCDFSIFDRKSILVTGGTGMVGSYLVETILLGCQAQGYLPTKLRIGGTLITESEKKYFTSFNFVEVSSDYLTHPESVGVNEIVFHLASPASHNRFKDLESLLFVNSDCLKNILNSQVEKFIYFSTGEVYGNQTENLLSEENHAEFDPKSLRSWYPYSKLKGEEQSKLLCSAYNIELTIIRLFHTFGPGVKKNDGRSFADFLYSVADGKLPTLKSQGDDIRTFLYSPDAVSAFINICGKNDKFNIYNVGSDLPMTILQFAQKISQVAGLGGEVKFDFSLNNKYIHSPNKSIVPDITKILSTGWKNRTDIDTAILETLEHIKTKKYNFS
jgi:nucleoside-diphosphate-sugar epimerase